MTAVTRASRPAHVARPVAAYDTLSRDGVAVRLRPAESADREVLHALVTRLSPRSAYQRFLAVSRNAPSEYVAELLDPARTLDAVVASWQGEVVGVASSHPVSADIAEVALLVDDAHQGRGVGTLLLEDLAARCRGRGIRAMQAFLLRTNQQMLDVFEHSGLEVHLDVDDSTLTVTVPLVEGDDFEAALARRQRDAAATSLGRLLRPRSVVVIGAGTRRDGAGHQVIEHLRRSEFRGSLYAVNLSGRPVRGITAYRSILEVPRTVDLAVVAVPAEAVLDVARDCALRRVGALAVLTTGFGSSDAALDAERELRSICRRAGMRLLGPACMGLVNTSREVRLDASFLPHPPVRGPVSVAAQSGAVAASLMSLLGERGLGVSTAVTTGSSSDVGPADLVSYAATDPATKVSVVHVESLDDPAGFARAAAVTTALKPVLLLKAGRSAPPSRADRGHTAAAVDDDAAVDALCRRSGITRVRSLTELADTAAVLSAQPAPRGRRVAIVGNCPGPGQLALDACVTAGLTAPDLTQHTTMRLRSLLPAGGTIGPLIDTTAAAGLDQLRATLACLAEDPGVDAIVAVVTPLAHLPAGAVREMLDEVSEAHPDVSVVAGVRDRAAGHPGRVPMCADPASAVVALAHAQAWAERRRTLGATPDTSLAPLPARAAREVHQVVAEFLARNPQGGWLERPDVARLLRDYGVELVPSVTADDPGTVAEAAALLSFPVALKAYGPRLLHKSRRGAVVLDLHNVDEVRAAARAMLEHLGDAVQGFVVQPQVRARRELIIGAARLPRWEPLVMVGRGGVDTAIDPDRAWGLAPVGPHEAAAMLRSLRCAPCLPIDSGRPGSDASGLTPLVTAVSRLVHDIPEVTELDLNPVMVGGARPQPVDARIRVEPVRELLLGGPVRRLAG